MVSIETMRQQLEQVDTERDNWKRWAQEAEVRAADLEELLREAPPPLSKKYRVSDIPWFKGYRGWYAKKDKLLEGKDAN